MISNWKLLTTLKTQNNNFERKKKNQARFALKFISGNKKMPSQPDMMKDMKGYEESMLNAGTPKSKFHYLGPKLQPYNEKLIKIAGITKNIPWNTKPVYPKMYWDAYSTNDPIGFRKYKYTIVDKNTFKKSLE